MSNEIITTLHPENDNNTNLYPNIKKQNIPNGSVDKSKLDNSILMLLESIHTLEPSGVDTSTTILAFTTNKGIYIGSDTGYWYYWNGTQYVSGGTYQTNIGDTTNIQDFYLSTTPTDLLNENVAFYNETYGGGNFSPSATTIRSEILYVEIGKPLLLQRKNGYNMAVISFNSATVFTPYVDYIAYEDFGNDSTFIYTPTTNYISVFLRKPDLGAISPSEKVNASVYKYTLINKVKNVNLFDSKKLTMDKFIYINGSINDAEGWAYTDSIPCEYGDEIIGCCSNDIGGIYAIALYNSSGVFIKGIYTGDNTNPSDKNQFKIGVNEPNAKYFRYNVAPYSQVPYEKQYLYVNKGALETSTMGNKQAETIITEAGSSICHSNLRLKGTGVENTEGDIGYYSQNKLYIIFEKSYFTNFGDAGIKIDNTVGTHATFIGTNLCFVNNTIGFDSLERAEYIALSNCIFNVNNIGIKIRGGNVGVHNCIITNNADGVVILGGSNDSHGIISNCQINHNTRYALRIDGVQYGETISGCHFYDGKIIIENCINEPIRFDNCVIACELELRNNYKVIFNNCYMPSGYGLLDMINVNTTIEGTDNEVAESSLENIFNTH